MSSPAESPSSPESPSHVALKSRPSTTTVQAAIELADDPDQVPETPSSVRKSELQSPAAVEITTEVSPQVQQAMPDAMSPTDKVATGITPVPAEEKPAFSPVLYMHFIAAGYITGGPWFAVVACMYFFEVTYIPEGHSPQFTMPMVMVVPSVVVQLVALIFGKKALRAIKVWISFALIAAAFYVMVYITKYVKNKETSYYLIMVSCAMQSCFESISLMLYFAVGAALDPNGLYISGIMVGTSLGGISSVLLEMLCLGVYGGTGDPYKYTSTFYDVILAILVVCIVSALLFEYHPLVAKELSNPRPDPPLKLMVGEAGKVLLDQGKNIILTYIGTYIVYPGVVIEQNLKCVSVQWSVPLVVFFFSIFDITGRFLANFFRFIPRDLLIIPILCRAIVCMLLFFIGYAKFHQFLVVDWLQLVCVSVFAFSNGMCATFAMKYGPGNFEPKKRGIVSKLMAFYLSIGIAVGTILSEYIFSKITPDKS